MAGYLEVFQLEREPFTMPAKGALVLGTPALARAHAELRRGLLAELPRLCVVAGAGMGKTSLARALPRMLGPLARVSLVSARRPWADCRRRAERHFGVSSMTAGPLSALRKTQRLVLVIDDADQLDEAALTELDRWLALHDGSGAPLLQCVLLANLDATTRREDDTPLLWWLDTLQTLQVELAPLPAGAVPDYIEKHLRKAGWTGEARLFEERAARRIHEHCAGNPRRIGELCRMLLTVAGEYGLTRVDAELVELAVERRRAPTLSPEAVERAEAVARERARRRRWSRVATGLALLMTLAFVAALWPRERRGDAPVSTPAASARSEPDATRRPPVRLGEPRRVPIVRHIRSADGSRPDTLIVPPGHPAHDADPTGTGEE